MLGKIFGCVSSTQHTSNPPPIQEEENPIIDVGQRSLRSQSEPLSSKNRKASPPRQINQKDEKGNTQLHNAVYVSLDFTDFMALGAQLRKIVDLLAEGESPNEQNHDGDTPLHVLCQMSIFQETWDSQFHEAIINHFMEHGADPTIPNKEGATGLDMIKKASNNDVLVNKVFKAIA